MKNVKNLMKIQQKDLTNKVLCAIIILELRKEEENQMKELLKNILGGIVGAGVIMGVFYILAQIANFILAHYWLLIPMSIIVIIMTIKEVNK